jgi:hypothetical protein
VTSKQWTKNSNLIPDSCLGVSESRSLGVSESRSLGVSTRKLILHDYLFSKPYLIKGGNFIVNVLIKNGY